MFSFVKLSKLENMHALKECSNFPSNLLFPILQDTDALDVNSNSWTSNPWPIKHQRIAYMQSRGPGCFDHRYYLQKNPDLKVLGTVLELWEHFVMLGQFEGRSYRYDPVQSFAE